MTSKLGFASLALALLAAAGVFILKDRVRQLEVQLRDLGRSVMVEEARLDHLHAEWATLERGPRLERLARAHLRLQPAHPRQLLEISDIPYRADLVLAQRRLTAQLPSGDQVTLRFKPPHRLTLPLGNRSVADAGAAAAASEP